LQAKGTADQAGADAGTLEQQAELERLKASDARIRGAQETGAARTVATHRTGEARALAAASGVDPSQGSAGDIVAATAALGELDALTIQSNAAREAWGHEAQSEMNLEAAKAKRKQGRLGALGGFLSTGAKAFGMGGG
jgi:hypothetical protein